MYTLKSILKFRNQITVFLALLMVASSIFWLFLRNGKPTAMNSDHIATPRVLSFSDADDYTRALHLLQDTLLLKPLALETVPIPFTDFTKVTLLSYDQATRRLIEGDPRRTSYFAELTVFFRADGGTGRLIYLSENEASQLGLIKQQLSAAGIHFSLESDKTLGVESRWVVILFFILILTATQEKSRKLLYRLLVYIPWILISVFNDSIIAALLSVSCIYASHILTELLPYIRKSQPKPAFSSSGIKSSVIRLGPVSLLILLFLALDRSLIVWLLGSLIITGLVFRFRNQLYQADTFYHYHKIPVFKPITQAHILKTGSALYFYLLFTVMFLAGLAVPAAWSTQQSPLNNHGTDNFHARSFSDLKETLLKHLFVQNALTEGIIGTYDPELCVYNVHNTNYLDSRPSGIVIMQKEYANSILALEAQLNQLDSKGFLPIQTAEHGLDDSQIKNGQIKQAEVLDTHTYLVSIIALALFFGHGILSRILHVHMLSYMEQTD